MSKTDSVKVKKEQLLSEHGFLEFCAFDFLRKKKLFFREDFLWAAMKDGFLKPLLKIKERVSQEDGTEKEILQNYYSPHQVYILAELEDNIVDDGLLRANNTDVKWSKEKGTRYVNWGNTGVNIDLVKVGKMPKELAILNIAKHFHNFLSLLHSLPQKENFDLTSRERHFTGAPYLGFDYSSLKTGGLAALKSYGLNVLLLRFLKAQVGLLATEVDPLEYWYYYIKLHPRWRKDLFKGRAALAQDLYIICEILDDVLEAVTGESPPPLLEFLHPDFSPFLLPAKVEYAQGVDVQSLKSVIENFKYWSAQVENRPLIEKVVLEQLDNFEEDLADYEKRYGDRSYLSGVIREVKRETKIKVDDLDQRAKSYVGLITKQTARTEQEETITMAIEHSLDQLRRQLWEIIDQPSKKLREQTAKEWETVNNFSQWFWINKKDQTKNLTREQEQKLYDKEYNKARKRAAKLSQRREVLDKILSKQRMVFCSHCRKNPVQLHYTHNDRQVSKEPICDNCFKKLKEQSLDSTFLEKVKDAELKCGCGKLLYKFAQNNTLALQSRNNVDIRVTLEYGRNNVEAKCPQCHRVTSIPLDWGWLP